MLEFDRIDISEGIDINETNPSKECKICHYWCFLDKSFKYEPYLCHGFHNLMSKAMNFNDVAIVSILILKKVDHYNFFLLYVKNEWNNLL